MKLFLYTDVHWSETSSIVRSRGSKYSTRLENLIKSVNWAESLATQHYCDAVVNLGDFFDRPNLTSEEITALTELEWADMPHYFLVGNHDANINDLSYASTFVFNKPNFHIISKPTLMPTDIASTSDILLLPYIIEDNRQRLAEYFVETDKMVFRKRIVLSHNDIAGIQYGLHTSTEGFGIGEILGLCDKFINGHLHNSGFVDVAERVLNLGNLSGLNFNEDATTYKHYAAILDTETLDLDFYENPYAFNFYKLRVDTIDELTNLKIGSNAVVSIQCPTAIGREVRSHLENIGVVECRLTTTQAHSVEDNVEISELTQVDHLQKFSQYVLEHLDNTDILKEELTKVVD